MPVAATGIVAVLLTTFPIFMMTGVTHPATPCGTSAYTVSTDEQQAFRPRYRIFAGFAPMYTSSGTLVRSPPFAALVSSSGTGPSPVPQNTTMSPGFAAAVGESSVVPTNAIASPVPLWLMVNMPKLFWTTVMGAGALVCPLKVTVTLPVPTGVDDGRIAATCAASA